MSRRSTKQRRAARRRRRYYAEWRRHGEAVRDCAARIGDEDVISGLAAVALRLDPRILAEEGFFASPHMDAYVRSIRWTRSAAGRRFWSAAPVPSPIRAEEAASRLLAAWGRLSAWDRLDETLSKGLSR